MWDYIMCLFCSQSRPLLNFSVWYWGCADLCKVTLLCLWILWDILSVAQGTIRCLLASSKSLPLFEQLIFSTLVVCRLWVCSCLVVVSWKWPFFINIVFHLVIYSGMCVSCRHLCISSGSLLWMDVDFIPSWPDVFQFYSFYCCFE